MKTIKTIVACSIFFMLTGCVDGLNENPNKPDDNVDYNLNDPRLFSTLRAGIAMEGDDEQRVKSLMVDFYAQVADGGNFNTKYYFMNDDWNRRMYTRVQSNVSSLNIVIRNLSKFNDLYAHSIAVAKIWRVFNQASAVDYFGPIPFSKYSEIEDNPPYMSVEDNYKEFFKELEEAVALLEKDCDNPIFMNVSSDIIFKNKADKWMKFANSLRLRYAMRLSEVAPALCKAEAAKAIAAGVMESTADKACLPPKANGDWGQDYNYTMFQISWGGPLNMTSTFEKLVTGIGGFDFPAYAVNKRKGTALSNVHPEKVDPRAVIMFDPAATTGDWKGIPYGLPDGTYNTGDYKTENFSEFGFLYQGGEPYKSRPYDVFLYEEACFLKAEAAARGFVTGVDAKAEYEKGVRASFSTWGANGATEYLLSEEKNLAGTSAKFDDEAGAGNTKLEKIITQKYLAAFPDVSLESWNDKRRLNLPRFDVSLSRNESQYNASNKDIKDPKNFIKRVQYPEQEKKINNAEYERGVQMLGGQDITTTPLWWDLNKNYCTSAQ